MTHIWKKHRQFKLRRKDPAVVGRLGGGFPVPANDCWQDLYGIGSTGIGSYSGSDMDATSSQGTDADDTTNGTEASGDVAGGAAAGSNSL